MVGRGYGHTVNELDFLSRFRIPRIIPDDGSARDVEAELLLHTVILRLRLSEFE
jgi:hypothetical protein